MFSKKLAIEINTFTKWFNDNNFKCIEKNSGNEKNIKIFVEELEEIYEEPGRNKLDKILKMIIEHNYHFVLYEKETYKTEKETKTILKYFKQDAPKPVKPLKKNKKSSSKIKTDDTTVQINDDINHLSVSPFIELLQSTQSNETITFTLDNSLDTSECNYIDTLDMITDDLIEIFGTPVNSNIDDDRYRYEWKFKSSNGVVFHLYDWKFENEDFPKLMDAEWYIGCNNPDIDISLFWGFMNTKFNELQSYYDNLNNSTEDSVNTLVEFNNDSCNSSTKNKNMSNQYDEFEELFGDISNIL